MNSLTDSTLVMLGLTGTGKTNFLAALDVVLDDQVDPDGLVHSDLASDRAYLQPLKEKWLRGEEFVRTSSQQPPPPHQLLVQHVTSGVRAGLYLPDLAGETFESHFVMRSFPDDFCERLENARGLLLFLHCSQNSDHTIFEHPTFIEQQPDPEATPASSRIDPLKWQLENASRQVQLVDLLQFIAEVLPRQIPLRTAVIISAWDLVEKAHLMGPSLNAEIPKDPTMFLSIQWPLVNQYLQSNPEIFQSRVFGVSARGGGTTPEEIARLIAYEHPSDRIFVVDGAHRSKDLTRPVRWVLGLLDSEASTGVSNG